MICLIPVSIAKVILTNNAWQLLLDCTAGALPHGTAFLAKVKEPGKVVIAKDSIVWTMHVAYPVTFGNIIRKGSI